MTMVALGEVAEVIYGFAFDSASFGDDGDLPLVRIRDVVRGKSSTFYSGDYEQKYIVDNGDLLIGMDGEFNRERWNGGKALLNQRVCRVAVIDPRLDESYLYWFLPAALKEIERQTPFVTVKHLSAKQIKSLEVPLPPIEEQRRIASILDAADALRTKRRQSLAKLDTLTQAIFIDMFGDFDANTLRWSAVELGNIVSESRLGLVRGAGELDDEHPIPYIRMNAIGSNGELDLANVRRTLVAAAEIKSGRLEPGDLLFNTRNSRELVGKTAIFRGNGTFVFNNNILRLRFTTEANPEYVNAAIRQPIVQRSLEVRKAGTTNVFAIYFKDLATVQMPLPPIDLQREFAGRIEALRNLVVPLETSATALDMVFAALQHRAFRGEL